jgi:hypothetical protein
MAVAKRDFTFDEDFYREALIAVGGLSRLFSESELPFFHYRFVENLFVRATKGKNISRQDAVFDALVGENNGIAVGVKTFTIKKKSSYSYEKVQEFTALAGKGQLGKMKDKELVLTIAKERNRRILLESATFNADPDKSLYHCLIRREGQAVVHEEPYPVIAINKIKPLSPGGKTISQFGTKTSNIHFHDGINYYRYSRAKNVLLKRFEIKDGENWRPIPIKITEDVFSHLFENVLGAAVTPEMKITGLFDEPQQVPGIDYVVLPLYSTKSGVKEVPGKSGLNQWNAAGRARKFGEAYIPVPSDIHKCCKGFFPIGKNFNLYLPNTKEAANASLCQSGYKALMTNPNDELCKWIFKVIDPNFSPSMYNKPPSRKPFTYSDLEMAGYDSVRVSKINEPDRMGYEIQFEAIGAYEEFLEEMGVTK